MLRHDESVDPDPRSALADLVAIDNTKKEILYEKGLIHTRVNDSDEASYSN